MEHRRRSLVPAVVAIVLLTGLTLLTRADWPGPLDRQAGPGPVLLR